MRRKAIAQTKKGATPIHAKLKRLRPARGAAGRTTSMVSALVASQCSVR
jgi:hypothetical protein